MAFIDEHVGRGRPLFAVRPGALYSVTETGVLSRFDAKTGDVTDKTRIDPAVTAFTSSPWACNGKVYFLSEEGQTFVVAAGDRLVLRTEHRLYSIRRSTPPPKS
jgi:outer membrane protein assembly factor BamB